jgi:hypothetical protein
MMHKTRRDSVPLTQMDCVRALRQFLCAKVMDLNRYTFLNFKPSNTAYFHIQLTFYVVMRTMFL